MIVILLLIVLCFVAWIVKIKGIKIFPSSLSNIFSFIGHAYLLRGNSADLWKVAKQLSRECLRRGGVLKLRLGPQTYYLITDPDDALTVANTCLDKHIPYDFAKQWLGNGLITSSGNIWKRHRKLLNPAFSLQVLLGFLDIFNDQSRRLLTKLDAVVGNGLVDISLYLRQMALENVCLTVFGISSEENAKMLESYAEAAGALMNLMTYRFQNIWLHSDFLYSFTKYKKKEDAILKEINTVADLIIKRKRAAKLQYKQTDTAVSGVKSKPLLELLLELSDEEALTDQEIRQEVDTTITAALDTTVWALMYIIVLLGSYQRVQEKVYEELREIFGKEDRDVNKYDLPKLTYLEAVIKESMRLYSILPITLRTSDKDVKLKNCILKTGSHCAISVYGLHRHHSWGPDRWEFSPERWMEPETQNLLFAGFSLGRRTCLGKTYAMMSLKIALIHLLRHYKFTANVNDLRLKLDFILKPISGHFVSIERRTFCDGDSVSIT